MIKLISVLVLLCQFSHAGSINANSQDWKTSLDSFEKLVINQAGSDGFRTRIVRINKDELEILYTFLKSNI